VSSDAKETDLGGASRKEVREEAREPLEMQMKKVKKDMQPVGRSNIGKNQPVRIHSARNMLTALILCIRHSVDASQVL